MSDENEKDIQDLINQYTQQQNAFQPNPAFSGDTSQGIDPHKGIDNQGGADESTPLTPGTMGATKGPDPIPTGNTCPQCNMMHPPLRPGEKCPNAKAKAMTEEGDDISVDVNKYLVNLQNILMSQIDKKKIKDVKKLIGNITMEITKFLEEYQE
jgi:hypothetical protein